jgi:type I restriction enzyme S subunit
MSSEAKMAATKKDGKPALMPKLRFPEFWEAGGWTEKPLKAAAHINPPNSGLPESFFYIDLESVDAGKLKSKTRISRVEAPSRAQRLLERDDIIYQVVRPYQRNNLLCEFDDDEDYVASTGYAQLRARGSSRFLYQSVHTDSFVGRVIAKCSGSSYPAINSSDLAEIELPLPPTLAEQQKIAECLSSVDELIAAQARKLGALKTYKKGLVQQLFPCEGEIQPRLRFPEFRDKGKWEERSLKDFIEEFRGRSTVQDEFEVMTSARSGLVRQRDYYDNDRLIERDNIGFNIIPPNYLTYRSRSDDRQFFFNENNLGITGIVSIYYPVFRIKNGSNKFVLELLSSFSKLVGKYSVGTSQTVLSLNQLGRIRLPFPDEAEQQRIANCLSSIDSVATAEAQKLSLLKRHKSGLMQQLFPFLEKVEA